MPVILDYVFYSVDDNKDGIFYYYHLYCYYHYRYHSCYYIIIIIVINRVIFPKTYLIQ